MYVVRECISLIHVTCCIVVCACSNTKSSVSKTTSQADKKGPQHQNQFDTGTKKVLNINNGDS
jgi:hypothetical protein